MKELMKMILGPVGSAIFCNYKCPRCNWPLETGTNPCPNCGQPLDWNTKKIYKSVLKIDLDVKMPKRWLKLWEKSRKGLLASIGLRLVNIITKPSSRRGYHVWLHIESDKRLSDRDLNHLQLLCGDDTGRVLIAARRIRRKIKNWDKLFDHTIWRREHNCNCAIHQKICQRMKEGQKAFMGVR